MSFLYKPSAQSTLIADGLLSRYAFEDEGDTTTLTDTAGTNDMSISGMTYTTNAQESDHAGSYDGVDDMASVEATIIPTDQFSFVCWVYSTGTGNDFGGIFGNIGASNTEQNGIGLRGNPATIGFVVNDGSFQSLSFSASTDVWVHVAGTYDAGDMRLYIDGTEQASQTVGATVTTYATTAIGLKEDGIYYGGRVDDARIYDRALSAGEVSDIAGGSG